MKNNISYTALVFLLGLTIFRIVYAVEAGAAEEVFKKAEILERTAANYPYARAKKSHEGIVELGVMVSIEGNVYSPVVSLSTHVDFEESALEAVKKYKFSPATLNGTPVDSHYVVRVRFDLEEGGDAVSERFSKFYKTAKKELAKDEPNQKKLERKIKSMSETFHMTHYSLAHLASVKAQTAAKFSDQQTKLSAFKQLLIFDDAIDQNGNILDDYFLSWTRSAVIATQLGLGKLQAAYWNYLDLQKTAPKSAQKFDANMVKVKSIISSGEPFAQQLALGARAYQEVSLSDTNFEVQDIVGNINKLTFRCQKGFTEIEYQASSEYFVLSDWGPCKIQISGSKETTATLVRFK